MFLTENETQDSFKQTVSADRCYQDPDVKWNLTTILNETLRNSLEISILRLLLHESFTKPSLTDHRNSGSVIYPFILIVSLKKCMIQSFP